MTSAPAPAGTFQVTVQPSGRRFSVNAGRSDPGGRHPPGHRPALRLQGRRLRLVQVQEARGRAWCMARTRARPCRRGRSRRLRADLLRRAADRRGARIAPGHRRERLPDQEDAVARAVAGEEVARRDGDQAAAARQRHPALPRRPVRRVHPARRRAPQLLDGQRAAHLVQADAAAAGRPRDRTAHPPHARRQVHRPCVRRDEGKGNPARRRARTAASSCARTPTSRWCCWPRAPALRRSRR